MLMALFSFPLIASSSSFSSSSSRSAHRSWNKFCKEKYFSVATVLELFSRCCYAALSCQNDKWDLILFTNYTNNLNSNLTCLRTRWVLLSNSHFIVSSCPSSLTQRLNSRKVRLRAAKKSFVVIIFDELILLFQHMLLTQPERGFH